MLATSRLQTIICTTWLDQAESFYGQLLGLKKRATSEGALVFDVGGSDLRVSPVPAMTPSEHTVVGFAVNNLTEVVARLTTAGVKFERFSGFNHDPNGILTTPQGSKVAWLLDPDGNLLSIVQYG